MFAKLFLAIIMVIQIDILYANTILDQKADRARELIFNTLQAKSLSNIHDETLMNHTSLVQDYLENFEILPKLTKDGYYIQIYQNPSNASKFLGNNLPQYIIQLMTKLNFDDGTSESIEINFLDEFGNSPHIFVGQSWVNSIEMTAIVKDNAIKNFSTRQYDQMDFFIIKPSQDAKEVSILLPNYPSREKIKYIQGITTTGEKISAKRTSTQALNIQRSDSFMISVHLQLLELYHSNLIQDDQEWASLYEHYQTQQDNRYLFTTYEHKLIFEAPVTAIHIELESGTQSTQNFSTTISNRHQKPSRQATEQYQ